MSNAVLFKVTKTWNQPKCLPTDEWIKKTWDIFTVEYYSATRKNEIMPSVATWLDLEVIITKLSKSDRERQISYDITYMQNLKK